MKLTYSTLRTLDPTADKAAAQRLGDGLLANAAEVHEWTASALANDADVTELERYEAYAHELAILELEWSWHAFFASVQRAEDQPQAKTRATELEATFREMMETAVTYVEAETPETPDEQRAAANVYYAQAIIALLIDEDDATYQSAIGRFTELLYGSATTDAAGTRHRDSICTEVHELHAGQALATSGDTAGATKLRSDDALLWADLGRYALASGDTNGRDAAYTRFLSEIETRPAFERMGLLRVALADLQTLVEDQPDRSASIAPLFPALQTFLNDMRADGKDTFAYANLYTDLGRLALFSDESGPAAMFFQLANDLDSHQPLALNGLALAALTQDSGADAELTALVAELNDSLWEQIDGIDGFDRTEIVNLIDGEIERYSKRFPDRAAHGVAVSESIDQ